MLNKLDQLPEDTREEWCQHIVNELDWDGAVFQTSGLLDQGTKEVIYHLMGQIEEQKMLENDDPEYAAQAKAFREQLEEETREQTLAAKEAYRAKRKAQREGDEIDTDDDEDDSDMEVIYVRD